METTIDVFDRIAAEMPPYAGLTYADVQETTEQWPPVGGKDLYFGGERIQKQAGQRRWSACGSAAGDTGDGAMGRP